MGVTQLWSILEPVKQQGDLASLKGKTLCVDLSGWICEAQGSKGLKANVLKPHLRNLFFRVWNLTRVGVKLVFVVDGDAPEVKWEAIVKRNEARNGYGVWGRKRGGGRMADGGQRKKDGRSNFRIWVKECMTLLRLLGVPYVESAGEAEALCAWMNAQGIVDGCITNDGDAFLYGARNVYKDLCISSKECMMDSYCMDDIETKLCLNREKLVSLAILLGCDYLPQGVPGVGKEMGLKLVQALQGVNLLQRLQDWKGFKGCEYGLSKIETTVKLKASKVAGFPSQAVINEFMCPELKTQQLTVPKGYRCPDLKGLQEFCLNYLEWPEDYTTEKVFPLMTYWQMEAGMSVKHCNRESIVTPERIVKARVQNRIECYEILWKSKDIGDACQSTFVTIETRSLFGQVYPILVEEFEILQNEKKKKKKGKRKAKHDNAEDLANGNRNALEELCGELQTLSLAAERVSLLRETSQTKLRDGKQAASSEYAMAETEWEKKQEGSSLDDENMKQEEEQVHGEDDEQQHSIGVKYLQRNILDSNELKERKARKGKNGLKSEENIVHDVKKRQKRQELQQRCELDDKQQHSDGTKYVRTGNLVPDDENGKKVLKKKKNLEVKVSKVEDPLDSVTSSEEELSDSFLCEFVAPLAQRLERQWPHDSKNEKTVDHNARGDFPDLVHSADSKSANKCNLVDNGIQVVLIDSSEDETEQDEIHGSRGNENSRQKPHITEKPEGSSSRKYDGQTTRYLESDVKMKSLGREEMCARTEHKIHIALKKTEDEGTLNGKEIRREAVFLSLVNEAVSSNAGYRDQMATDKTKKNDVEISETKKPGNNCHERFPSSLPRQSGLPVKGFNLSAVSLSRDDRASVMASSHCGKKIQSDWKPKVMQRVYFSSDDDDDDSWFIGSGNGAATPGAGAATSGAGGGGNGAAGATSGAGGNGAGAATPGDKHRDGNADDYWYIGTTNDDGGSATAAGDLGGHSWYTDSSNDDSVVAVASAGGNNHIDTKHHYSCGGDADDKEKTKSKKSTKTSKKKGSKMSSSKTMDNKPLCLDLNLSAITDVATTKDQTRQKTTEGKMSTSELVDNKIHLGKLTSSKYMEANGRKMQVVPLSKLHSTASQLKMKQTDSHNNVGQVSKLHSSTHEQDIFSVVDRSEKISTPKLLEKTEGKENVESPLDDVFVPLSLSERLGRNLSGRRNVLNTLRTLSSN